jgi:hypothetical protein
VAAPQPGIALVAKHAYNATVSAVNASERPRGNWLATSPHSVFPSLAAPLKFCVTAGLAGQFVSRGDRRAGPAPASDN